MTLLPDAKDYPASRLFSLDLLRGFDMFMLVVVCPIVHAANNVWHFPQQVMYHFGHPEWVGFSMWDMVMPLFIFMCGAAIPFALPKRLQNGRPTAAFWKHVFSRVALLWFCGMLAQGQLATLDAMKISPYNNTLQTIAIGYLIAALVLLVPSKRLRIAIPVMLAALYGFLLKVGGDYTETGNYANIVEMKILSLVCPAGSEAFKTHNYTWFLTSLMFGFMTLCGFHATEILRSAATPWKRARNLALMGAGLLVAGFAIATVEPVIKHIFTVSFTCQAMGYSVLLLAAFFVLSDIWKIRRGLGILILFGQFALTAYMTRGFFGGGLAAVARTIGQGLPHLFGTPVYQGLCLAILSGMLLTGVLIVRRLIKARA